MYVFFLFFPFFSQKARTSAVEITHLPLLPPVEPRGMYLKMSQK